MTDQKSKITDEIVISEQEKNIQKSLKVSLVNILIILIY